jgi:MYXO-CTERM domain-containing protein
VNLTCPIYSGNGCQVIGFGTFAQAQASVDTDASTGGTTLVGQVPQPSGTVASGSNASATGTGCATSAQGGKSRLAVGALAGLLGLAVGRAIRMRRRRSRSSR